MKKTMTLLLLAVTLLCSHAYAQNRGSELMKQAETSLSQNEYVKARYLFLQAYSAFIQQADYANAAKCAVQTSALYHRENYYKEAFDVLRAAEQNILSANQQNAQTLATLRFPITKERLRMYIKLKNTIRAKDQLGQLEEQAKAAGSDSLSNDLLYTQATYYYKKGFIKGDADASLRYGQICLENEEYPEAFKAFRNAAGYGRQEAMYELAELYRKGLGTDANKAKAIEWYKACLNADDEISDKARERLKALGE